MSTNEIPDNGRDIGAALMIYSETLTSIIMMSDNARLEWLNATLAWLVDGEYTEPQDKGAVRVFREIVRKHTESVEEYREKKRKSKAAADARWDRERGKDPVTPADATRTQCDGNADAMRTQCDGNADAMLTLRGVPLPSANLPGLSGGGVTRAPARKDAVPQPLPTAAAEDLDFSSVGISRKEAETMIDETAKMLGDPSPNRKVWRGFIAQYGKDAFKQLASRANEEGQTNPGALLTRLIQDYSPEGASTASSVRARKTRERGNNRGGYDSRATNIHHMTERNPNDVF